MASPLIARSWKARGILLISAGVPFVIEVAHLGSELAEQNPQGDVVETRAPGWLIDLISMAGPTIGLVSVWPARSKSLPAPRASFLAGVATIWLGMALRQSAHVTLGRFHRGDVTIHAEHDLVSEGPYAYIRHPPLRRDDRRVHRYRTGARHTDEPRRRGHAANRGPDLPNQDRRGGFDRLIARDGLRQLRRGQTSPPPRYLVATSDLLGVPASSADVPFGRPLMRVGLPDRMAAPGTVLLMNGLDHVSTTRAAYDATAEVYTAWVGTDISPSIEAPLDRALLHAFAESLLTRAGLVADVGCGPGRVAASLAEDGLQVLGVDVSPAMLAVARAAHPDILFEEGTLAALPIPSASLAGAVCWYSIIHTPPEHLAAVCDELARVTALEGLVLLAFQAGAGDAVHRSDLHGSGLTLTSFRHAPDQVTRCLTAAGFHPNAQATREPEFAHESTPQAFILARRS